MAKRDRRKPLEMHRCIPCDHSLEYFHDVDGSARPKAPPDPPLEPVAVLRHLLELDRLSRGRNGEGYYNPRICIASVRDLIAATVTLAAQEKTDGRG